MNGISIQERYDDISEISGLSEDIIRRVLKASRQSMVKSLKKGERATLPGIVTVTPELKHRYKIGLETELEEYIKLKASPSPALGTEMEKLNQFVNPEDESTRLAKEEANMSRLNIGGRYNNQNRIITTQINALL
jgi:hypothetical protein